MGEAILSTGWGVSEWLRGNRGCEREAGQDSSVCVSASVETRGGMRDLGQRSGKSFLFFLTAVRSTSRPLEATESAKGGGCRQSTAGLRYLGRAGRAVKIASCGPWAESREGTSYWSPHQVSKVS